jgi:hypothetical protein
MECRDWIDEIVETARSGNDAPGALAAHLRGCNGCAARWTAERNLNVYIDAAREAGLLRGRSRLSGTALWNQAHPMRPGLRSNWTRIVLAAAAMLVLALAVGVLRHPGVESRPVPAPVALAAPELPAADDEALVQAGFVEVPYAPPLAAGESLNVELTELSPAELADMGMDWNLDDQRETLLAEVVTGEDGLPRAVRVLGDMSY